MLRPVYLKHNYFNCVGFLQYKKGVKERKRQKRARRRRNGEGEDEEEEGREKRRSSSPNFTIQRNTETLCYLQAQSSSKKVCGIFWFCSGFTTLTLGAQLNLVY